MKKQNLHIAAKQMLLNLPTTGDLVRAYNKSHSNKVVRRVALYLIKQRLAGNIK